MASLCDSINGRLVDFFEDQVVDGVLTEVFGNLWSGIVSPKKFLVNIFFKDIAEYMRTEFVILTARSVVQIPGVVREKRQQIFKSDIGYADTCPAFFDGM